MMQRRAASPERPNLTKPGRLQSLHEELETARFTLRTAIAWVQEKRAFPVRFSGGNLGLWGEGAMLL